MFLYIFYFNFIFSVYETLKLTLYKYLEQKCTAKIIPTFKVLLLIDYYINVLVNCKQTLKVKLNI